MNKHEKTQLYSELDYIHHRSSMCICRCRYLQVTGPTPCTQEFIPDTFRVPAAFIDKVVKDSQCLLLGIFLGKTFSSKGKEPN